MRLLADENFPRVTVRLLRSCGHDLMWIHEITPGINDVLVLARATTEKRTLITFDKDFGDLVFRQKFKAPAGIILVRISSTPTSVVSRIAVTALDSRIDWTGHFWVVRGENDIRMRCLPNS
ncbi:MAG: DUF5615 family PIN-like protein [Candidatus Poribacteria bacterium]|nr:DUF5615 family PIN-like protein [Candidatus Poribacteria bacterium]